MQAYRTYTRRLILGGTALFLLATLAACGDANFVTNTDDEATPAQRTERAARLSTDLGLSTEQANQVNDLLTGDGKPEPGSLWRVAAALQQTLTDAQKATLFAKGEQRRAAFAENGRGRRFNRDGARQDRRFNREGRGPRFQRQRENGAGLENDFFTPEQQEQMKALRAANRDALQALVDARQAGTLSPEDFRAQARTLRESHREAVEALLTDEQKATLTEKREAMKARHEDRREAADAARAEALGLTTDQEAALAAMRDAHRAETRALLEQARAHGLDRDALRTDMQALREAHKAALADILTPEQIEITEIHTALVGGLAARRGGPEGFRGARGFRGQNG